jgi:hypothetical protein
MGKHLTSKTKTSGSRVAKSSAVFIAINGGINYKVLFPTWSQNRLSLLEEERNLIYNLFFV